MSVRLKYKAWMRYLTRLMQSSRSVYSKCLRKQQTTDGDIRRKPPSPHWSGYCCRLLDWAWRSPWWSPRTTSTSTCPGSSLSAASSSLCTDISIGLERNSWGAPCWSGTGTSLSVSVLGQIWAVLCRDVGAAQSVCLELGVDRQAMNYRRFDGALNCGHCRCCKHQANLLLCRVDSGNIV